MARFLGSVKGSRGEATRLGGSGTGLVVKANGWNLGVRVEASDVNGHDHFDVYVTGGSNGGSGEKKLAVITPAGWKVIDNKTEVLQ
jgi:hypothetical protein